MPGSGITGSTSWGWLLVPEDLMLSLLLPELRVRSTMLLDLLSSGSVSRSFICAFGLAEHISPIERARAGEVGAEGTRFGGGFTPIGETLPVIGGVVGRAVAAARAVILR